MRARATIAVRGRVGDHDLLPGPWLEGLADSLAHAGPIAVAFVREDGAIKHATMIAGSPELNSDSTLLHLDVEIADADLETPPPHGGLSK